MLRFLSIITLILTLSAPAFSQGTLVDADDNARKVELAETMHELRPVRAQVENAIDQFAKTQAPNQRETFKTAMRSVINVKALEQISVDAYVSTFNSAELEAMVDYYSKPEAQSASAKFDNYAAIVYPEIIRMLDKAAIRVKTGQ